MRRYDGWTLGDLAGELWARGIDIDSISSAELDGVLSAPYPDRAADCLANGVDYSPPHHPRGCECMSCYEAGR